MTKDYSNWLSDLKEGEIESWGSNDLYQKHLFLYPTIDYFTQKQSMKFLLNNIGALIVDEKDGSVYHSFPFPRCADVITCIKSTNPKVCLSVFIGGQRLKDPSDPILLIAAQYHEVVVRLSFDRNSLSKDTEFGIEYNALYFQNQYRRELAQSSWNVQQSYKYKSGICVVY